jgi:hypothetical protein
MNPPSDSPVIASTSNPQYLPASEFDAYDHSDEVVVFWRSVVPALSTKCRVKLFWPHDTCHGRYSAQNLAAFDGCLWLSRWQLGNYLDMQGLWAKIPYTIMGNGWSPITSCTIEGERPLRSCIYGSNWARGLENVLDVWPEVRRIFPDATLTVCYGSETWNLWSKDKEQQVLRRVEGMKDIGVVNKGSVDHETLEKLYHEHSFWLYPNTGTETFCITAVKAQGAGCIPVATRASGLFETLAPFAETCLNSAEWSTLLVKALRDASSIKLEDRRKYADWSKIWYWKEIAQRFDTFVKSIQK